MRIRIHHLALAAASALSCAPGERTARGADSTATLAATSAQPAADSAEITRLATEVTRRGLRIRKGDVVMISGGGHTVPAMEALAIETQKLGGFQTMLYNSDRVLRAQLVEIPEEYLSLPQTYFADWLRSTTVYIGLPGLEDPKAVFADVPQSRLVKWNEQGAAIYDMLNASKLRGAYIDYPSAASAAVAGMDPKTYTRMQLAAIGADPDAMLRAGQTLESKLRSAKTIHITSPAGTDLRVELAGRAGNVDAGMLAPGAEKEKVFAKRWFVLPGGNVGVAPRETSATGVAVIPRDQCKFNPVRGARYEFTGGAVTKVTAEQGEACLKESIESFGPNMKRLSLVAVGLNPELHVVEEGGDYRPYNGAGVVSITLGDNTLFGGSNRVPGATTFNVPVVNATVEVDGDVVVRDGKLTGGSAQASRQ